MKLLITFIVLLVSFENFGKCIAHRGDVENHFQNSMSAFISAYELGATGTELDIYHTKDKYALVLHDKTLKDLAQSRPGKKCNLNKSVKKQKLKSILNNCVLKNGEDIPTLEDVFKEFYQKDFTILIEFKDSVREKTFKLIKKYYQENPNRVRLMRLRFPFAFFSFKIKRFFRPNKWGKFKAFSSGGSANFINRSLYDGVDVRKVSNYQLKRLKKRGKEISVYTYNSISDIEKYFDLNVDFVTTDNLSNCLSVQREF